MLDNIVTKGKVDDTTTKMALGEKEIRIMVAHVMIWQDFILSKPVFCLNIKSALRNSTIKELPKNIMEAKEINFLIMNYKMKGLTNIAFFNKFKDEFTVGLKNIMATLDESSVAGKVHNMTEKFKEAVTIFTALPVFIDTFVL